MVNRGKVERGEQNMSQDTACNYCGGERMARGYLQGARLSFQPVSTNLADTTPGVGAAIQPYACLDCGAIQLKCDTKELQVARGE